MNVRSLIDAAITIAGTQAKLGRACGVSQNAIFSARRKGRCSANLAARIERATGIDRRYLCPEVFSDMPAKIGGSQEARP